MVKIVQVREADSRLTEAFGRLMPQLSDTVRIPSVSELEQIVKSASTALFCAEDAGKIVGVLSLAWYEVPSGRCAWIEDVIVDASHRGCGTGKALVSAALGLAARIGVCKVSLTSHAARVAAHALYRQAGFERYETNLFRLNIKKQTI